MTWGPDELKEYVDRCVEGIEATFARDAKDTEAFRSLVQRQFEDLQTRWSARFNETEARHAAQMAEQVRDVGPLKKLIYIGVGVALAASVTVPLLINLK